MTLLSTINFSTGSKIKNSSYLAAKTVVKTVLVGVLNDTFSGITLKTNRKVDWITFYRKCQTQI